MPDHFGGEKRPDGQNSTVSDSNGLTGDDSASPESNGIHAKGDKPMAASGGEGAIIRRRIRKGDEEEGQFDEDNPNMAACFALQLWPTPFDSVAILNAKLASLIAYYQDPASIALPSQAFLHLLLTPPPDFANAALSCLHDFVFFPPWSLQASAAVRLMWHLLRKFPGQFGQVVHDVLLRVVRLCPGLSEQVAALLDALACDYPVSSFIHAVEKAESKHSGGGRSAAASAPGPVHVVVRRLFQSVLGLLDTLPSLVLVQHLPLLRRVLALELEPLPSPISSTTSASASAMHGGRSDVIELIVRCLVRCASAAIEHGERAVSAALFNDLQQAVSAQRTPSSASADRGSTSALWHLGQKLLHLARVLILYRLNVHSTTELLQVLADDFPDAAINDDALFMLRVLSHCTARQVVQLLGAPFAAAHSTADVTAEMLLYSGLMTVSPLITISGAAGSAVGATKAASADSYASLFTAPGAVDLQMHVLQARYRQRSERRKRWAITVGSEQRSVQTTVDSDVAAVDTMAKVQFLVHSNAARVIRLCRTVGQLTGSLLLRQSLSDNGVLSDTWDPLIPVFRAASVSLDDSDSRASFAPGNRLGVFVHAYAFMHVPDAPQGSGAVGGHKSGSGSGKPSLRESMKQKALSLFGRKSRQAEPAPADAITTTAAVQGASHTRSRVPSYHGRIGAPPAPLSAGGAAAKPRRRNRRASDDEYDEHDDDQADADDDDDDGVISGRGAIR